MIREIYFFAIFMNCRIVPAIYVYDWMTRINTNRKSKSYATIVSVFFCCFVCVLMSPLNEWMKIWQRTEVAPTIRGNVHIYINSIDM